MNRSASDIEREVEATRASVEETVEALKDKMTLGQMVDEAAGYFRSSGGSEAFSNLGAQMRNNPLPLALVGVGLAWLMSGRGQPRLRPPSRMRSGGRHEGYAAYDYRMMAEADEAVYAGASHPDYAGHSSGADDTWSEYESDRAHRRSGDGNGMRRRAHDARDMASGAASGVIGAASRLASGVGAAASALGSAASSVAGGARSGAGAAFRGGASAYRGASRFGSGAYEGATHYGAGAYRGASRLGSGAYERASRFGSGAYSGASRLGYRTRDSFSDLVEREPLVLAGLGLAVGAAIGALMPRTSTEDRLMGETRDQLLEDAEAYGREQFERGKRVAEEAYRTAREELEAQGLSPDELAEKVSELARTTMDRARESAGNVYRSAKEEAEAQGLTPASVGDRAGSVAGTTAERARESAGEQGFGNTSSGSTASTSAQPPPSQGANRTI